ncbi:transcription factor Sp7-like [Eriocheir sinensis]|uniref:transcription factor Sp7-like n=1 Tax=Eriocheir sinensis TaxID=95602 RepID=UPI0021C5F853|nr:transcription factor Sp7-like [Eriocheir sinensis]
MRTESVEPPAYYRILLPIIEHHKKEETDERDTEDDEKEAEGEASGCASYTDMSSTMRVTREATDALYSDPLLPTPAHAPAEMPRHRGPVHNPREAGRVEQQQQQQEYSGSHQGQARKVSPPYTFPFMNTPSPSDVSEGSQATTASPHISPQPQVQSGHHGMGAQGHASQQSLNPSPTFISLMDTSPPLMPAAQAFAYDPYHNSPSPTYILAPNNSSPPNSDSPPMGDASSQSVTPYNYGTFLDQQTPHSLMNIPSGPPSASRPTRVSPHPTPLSSPGNPVHPQEETKVRNGKMYTSYLNHSGHGSYFERQSRNPSGGPTPPPGGYARAHPAGQYSRLSHVYQLPDLPLRGFYSSYEGATPQLPQAAQVQPHPSFGAQGFHNYGSQAAPPPLQFAGQYPTPGTIFSYYNSQPPSPAAPQGRPQAQGGARRRTTSCCSSSGGSKAQAAGIERPSVSDSVREKERLARRAAQKTNLVPGTMRKRGCTCSRCQIVFSSSGHLKRHMESHGSNRRFKCEYPFCDVAYSRQDNLRKHVERAIHRREGDAYTIPISEGEDDEREQSDFSYFSCEGGFGVVEPKDDSDDPPPGGSGRGGSGGSAGVVL